MKALCLQLSIALCACLSISTLSAQSLQITCPDPQEISLSCLDDLPFQAGDSIGFVSLEGAGIIGVTGELLIVYSSDTTSASGCSGSPIEVTRRFVFSDDSQSPGLQCEIVYVIEQEPGLDAIVCDDIEVVLDEEGSGNLSISDIEVTPMLQCPGEISASILELTTFTCDDLENAPLENTLIAFTDCGEEIECTFLVEILDEESPEITCAENILVTTDPCVCEAPINFDDATAEDNCGAIITRIDTTGLQSGDLFPAGLTLLTFQAEDLSGNTSTCSVQVRVNSSDPGSIACEGNQNISLDQNCNGDVTPQMIVDEAICDIDSYKITLFDQQGNQLPGTTITGEYLGTIVTARATYECYGNYCELDFFVEDKIPPLMNCKDTLISCGELIAFPLPEISDNCGTFEVVLLNQKLLDVSCDSVSIDKIITRTYGIKDDQGDIVERCDQDLLITKFDIQEVSGPEITVMVDCGSDYPKDENGHPDPSLTGAPTLNNIELYPPSDLFCNVSLTYDDMVLNGGSTCGTTLLRTWTVFNWYCGEDGMATFKQSIAVVDTTNPELIISEDITISSASSSCETDYIVPEPIMSDNCQQDLQLDIFYPGGVEFDTNSIEIQLALGDHLIQYRLNDQCGNMVMQSYTVTVEDNIEPVAICESGMSFSLDGNGMAILTAKAFDNGSLDACSDAILEIARMGSSCGMDSDTVFGSEILLCCADIGNELMVALKVTDDAGNANSCMTSIQVVDEAGPTFLTSLPDITVSSDFPVDTSDLSVFGFVEQNVDFPMEIIIDADSVSFSGQNVNAVVMDNCSVNTIREFKAVDINMCQTGTIVRTFIVSDDFGKADTVSQSITVIAQRTFSESDITFPNDTSFMNECPVNLDPQIIASFPSYDEGFESMVAYTHEDDTSSYDSQGCYSIDRIWYVSDWCNRPDGLTFATFTDTQKIVIIDNLSPEITSVCTDTTICSFVSACGPHPVDISATGSDNCTSEDSLVWSFQIEFADERPDSLGSGNHFDGFLPVGVNVVTWILDDGCGNVDECSFNFTIESCLSPQPLCFLNQEFFISSQDTTDNDDDDPVNIVVVKAEDLDAGSTHPCGKDVTVAFSENPNDTERMYDCDDLGTQTVGLYAIDEDGKFDFCTLSFTVRDTTSEMLCGMGQVAGIVFGNEIDFVKDVNVALEGTDMEVMTDEAGVFLFPEMVTGGTYSVYPSKQDEAINGVSTIDLVLIQRHILGIQRFESPYKMIAADVNQTSNVSAADIIAIRKLLLGITDEFSNGRTWTFIPGDHVFTDPGNPWATAIPERHDIYNLHGHQELDFIGVKLGDVNESARLRNTATLTYKINGNQIDIFASEEMSFAGMFLELDLSLNDIQLDRIDNHSGNLIENHHVSDEMKLKLLLTDAYNHEFSEGDPIISLVMNRILTVEEIAVLMSSSGHSELVSESSQSASIIFRNETGSAGMSIGQNSPNPWTGRTTFDVFVPNADEVTMRVMDISGKVVLSKSLELESGRNVIAIDHNEMPSYGGMYIYEVNSTYGVASRKMMMIKN